MLSMTESNEVRMAGPRLAVRIAELMKRAVKASSSSQREIASRMEIGDSRLSQIINGDGNFHVATVARLFAAAGYTLSLHVFDQNGDELEIPRRGRREREVAPSVFLHHIETSSGQVRRVTSYSHASVQGIPVDFPVQMRSVAEAKKLASDAKNFHMSFDFGGELVSS